jgi:hypothetical protein
MKKGVECQHFALNVTLWKIFKTFEEEFNIEFDTVCRIGTLCRNRFF